MVDVKESGGGTQEEPYYPPLNKLLNSIGATMPVRVKCGSQMISRGADRPDFGLYSQKQQPKELPKHGVVEAKSLREDLSDVFAGRHKDQMRKYLNRYSILIVTNYREFFLFRRKKDGSPEPLEKLIIAEREDLFWEMAEKAGVSARKHGSRIAEFLKRSFAYSSSISKPQDVAWFLASYAREALANIENAIDDNPDNPLNQLRENMQKGIENPFEGTNNAQEDHLFCSTLAQTLFYGMFSSWVAQAKDKEEVRFDWRSAQHKISIPVLKYLYANLTLSGKMQEHGLENIIERAGEALNRIDKKAFFQEFESSNAIQHFYQPFLKEFDSASQVEMGVFYTPPEIIKFMVERVDMILREELKIEDGLADEKVHVLDPCCGTGAYIIEVLNKIRDTNKRKIDDALVGESVKKAALERIWGFEIMPAPFLVAHWRLDEYLKGIGASPMSRQERVKIILTNALTGWGKDNRNGDLLEGFKVEVDLATRAKREAPILVVIGNPPYNACAGQAPKEEGDLTKPYKDLLKKLTDVRRSNLDDLYVRFFRIAEMQIVKAKRGIVSYITSDSWLSKKSFTGMRAHFLRNFDKAWVEKMPGGVFRIKGFSDGIKQGVATSLLVKRGAGSEKSEQAILYRDMLKSQGGGRPEEIRRQLLGSLEQTSSGNQYDLLKPGEWNFFAFETTKAAPSYPQWPRLIDICKPETRQPGMQETRGGALTDIDKEKLIARMKAYHDGSVSWEQLVRTEQSTGVERGLRHKRSGFDPEKIRKGAIKKGYNPDMIIEHATMPFETLWAYYTDVPKLWNRHREDLWKQRFERQRFLISHASQDGSLGYPATFSTIIGSYYLLSSHTVYFPFHDYVSGDSTLPSSITANLSVFARRWIKSLGFPDPDTDVDVASYPWLHILAVCYSPKYISENAGMLRVDWLRVPMPRDSKVLKHSASLGNNIASFLDYRAPLPKGLLPAQLNGFGLIQGTDLGINVGWGRRKNHAITPAGGLLKKRKWSNEEQGKLRKVFSSMGIAESRGFELLGDAVDIYLNASNYWKGVPVSAWECRIGTQQVINKWLSYRERDILKRDLSIGEARHVTEMVQRLTVLILMGDSLDANYKNCCDNACEWPLQEQKNAASSESDR